MNMTADLPPALMTSEVGSFARKTIVERKPQIIQRVIADNPYPSHIVNNLHQFADEIASQRIAPLSEDGDDRDFWMTYWSQYAERTWLELPWYFAESYFYRRLLDIIPYFRPGTFYHCDPFLPQKILHEDAALNNLSFFFLFSPVFDDESLFSFLLHAALWGNRSDLSNYTVKDSAYQGTETEALRKFILIDHTDAVYNYLHTGVAQVDFINDNVGMDCLNDLLLADFLLQEHWAKVVVFHLKNYPFFVSDAMPADIERLIQKMQNLPEPFQALGNRLDLWVQQKKLMLNTASYWTSCLSFHQMPVHLHQALSKADLVILKGDVNYRRLLDDRHWNPTVKVEEIIVDFPKPFLILRTLKGEIIAGLEDGQAERIAAEDPTWLINGRRSIVQLVTNHPKTGI
jgi:uncharacterized protein with ATP-grasp and redox domains